MGHSVEHVTRAGAGAAIDALMSWEAPGCYPTGLHAGDVGWQLRMDDDVVERSLIVVRDGADVVAVAILDQPSLLRPAVRPDRVHDLQLASVLADLADGTEGTAPSSSSEAPGGSALRTVLSSRGWTVDTDAWTVLYRPLSAADAADSDPLSRPLADDSDIAERVEVQRSAFEGSTFTVQRWHQMAAGPGFDPALDLLRRADDGTPVAAATGWSAGPGRCGILEPVAAHPDAAGHGHGRAVSRAVIAALARAGASGVAVHTPVSNTGAVRAYEACGLRQVELTTDLVRGVTAG
jgi:ribosomal protein S18 acetylase RimI-like enzyme